MVNTKNMYSSLVSSSFGLGQNTHTHTYNVRSKTAAPIVRNRSSPREDGSFLLGFRSIGFAAFRLPSATPRRWREVVSGGGGGGGGNDRAGVR